MNLPDLNVIYKTINWYNNDSEHKKGESVGLFITIPSELANQYPDQARQKEDSSPSHITVLYIGNVSLELEEKIKEIVISVCEYVKPFKVKILKPKEFINDEKQQRILHSPIKSKKLHKLHDLLKKAFLLRQIPVDNKFPEYKPHITIAYINKDEENDYSDLKPSGEWIVDSVWLWGMSEPYLIPLGK